MKDFFKGIPSATKIVLSFIAAEAVIFLICLGFKGFFKHIALWNNDDTVICELSTSDFAFDIYCGGFDDNELQFNIVYAKFSLWGGDPFYESLETRPIPRKPMEKITVSVPEEYGITPDSVVKDEKGIFVTDTYSIGMEEELIERYGLSEGCVDFWTCGRRYCGPYLIELKDGREYIIYKSFDRLYLHTV